MSAVRPEVMRWAVGSVCMMGAAVAFCFAMDDMEDRSRHAVMMGAYKQDMRAPGSRKGKK